MSAKLRWLIAQLEAACWCKCEEIGEWWMENQIMGDVFSTCEFPLEDIEIVQQMENLYKHPVVIVAKGT